MKRTKFQRSEVRSAADLSMYLNGKEGSRGQFMALCPAHDDRNPSLSIGQGDGGKILLHCFAGCRYEGIVEAIEQRGVSVGRGRGLRKGPGLPEGVSPEFKGARYVAHWAYRKRSGEVLGYVVRYESGAGEKAIIPYFKKEQGKWKAGYAKELKDNRPLYNLDRISAAADEEEVWIVEGEKCADALGELGVLATTSLGGCGAAGKADWESLAGRKVVIWPDNDQPGKVYATSVLKMLFETGDSAPDIEVVVTDQLGLDEKEDVVDWIEKGYGRRDILSIPRQPAMDASDIGVIVVDQGEIWKAEDQAESLLMRIDPYVIFQRCGLIVRVSKTTHKKMQAREEQSVGLNQVTASYLLDLFNRKLTFVQLIKDEYKAIDPPAKLANRYLSRSGHWKLNTLTGLIYAPTLRPDGTILERPGYDEASGVFYDNVGTRFSPLKKDLDKENAVHALKRLCYPFRDFPFVSEEDESVALAAVLTALVRQSLRTAPLFGFTAPVAGSGKTLLANVVSIIATGRQAVAAPQGKDKEEERKHLFAKLLQGKPVLLIDNIERPLSSDVLCAILTAPGETYSDRILGRSEIVEVPTNITFMATGNNLSFQGDMTRRALLCTIDPECENPEARTNFRIKGRLENHVYKGRERYVMAGLTILKAYAEAGKPEQDIPQYGGFEDWSNWVRSALVWLGRADPNLTRKKIEREDPVKANLGRIMALWKDIYEVGTSVMVSEIVNDCNEALENKKVGSEIYELAEAFKEVTRSKGKQLDGSSIGYWLRSNRDKFQDGLKITKDPYSPKNRAEWVLVSA